MSKEKYFLCFGFISLISAFFVAGYQGYLNFLTGNMFANPPSLTRSILFRSVSPLLHIILTWGIIYMPLHLTMCLIDKVTFKIKAFMIIFVLIFFPLFNFSLRIENLEKLLYINNLDLNYMSENLIEEDFLFIYLKSKSSKISDTPLVKNMKNNKKTALSCSLTNTGCSLIGDKRFINKIHRVKYYYSADNNKYPITTIFSIGDYKEFTVNDFIYQYKIEKKQYFSDFIFALFNMLLIIFLILGLKTEEEKNVIK